MREGAVLLAGPGVKAHLPEGAECRHVPAGKLIPMAEGARLADPTRPVLAIGGDSDVYGAGLGDLLHAARRNTGLACVVVDNGMAAPGAATGAGGLYPLRPLALALAAGGTFVAQAVPEEDLGALTERALHHVGFALINIRQDWQPHGTHNLETDAAYDGFDREEALERAANPEQEFTGVLFREPERSSFEAMVHWQSPPVTAVSTVEWDEWERLLYADWDDEEADSGGVNPDGTGT
jgi:2-oxoglutarate/2-oxoacid ferredoxin oxidoreductase subunit beta